jgi:hypothetical protein
MGVRQIVFAKFLYQRAALEIRPHDELSSGIAVSLMHDAVEMVISEIAKELRLPIGERDSFPAKLEKIRRAAEEKNQLIADLGVLDLNKVRIAYKHNGILPAYSEAMKCQVFCEQFLESCCLVFFAHDFASVSLADLIKLDDLRVLVKAAERELAEGKHEQSVIESAKAFAVVSSLVEKLLPSTNNKFWSVSSTISGSGREVEYAVGKVIQYLEEIRGTTIAALLRLDLRSHQKFLSLAPGVSGYRKGSQPQVYLKVGKTFSKAEAEFCVRYVTEYAITVEKQLGD